MGTTASASSKQRKLKDMEKYQQQTAVVEYPDGSKATYTYPQLEETYNDLKTERGKLSAELGELIKPVSEQKAKLDAYVSEHMVNLTPAQIRGLQDKTEALDPAILQINVAEANIVDRCESCHMGIREPVKLTAASMARKGKPPDAYAPAFTSHPAAEVLKTHDPDKFGCSPCHQGNGRATTTADKAHGNYEHCHWHLFPQPHVEDGGQYHHA